MQVKISDIIIDKVNRALDTGKVRELSESIKEIGLLNDILLTSDKRLLAGNHRLAAVKLLGWTEIGCKVLESFDALHEELVGIDENLARNDLTVLERSCKLARRNEILKTLGLRAKESPGTNQHTKEVGELNSPSLKTTAEIAKEVGVSERTAQHYNQIARDIDNDVKDLIGGTEIADTKTDLLLLSKIEDKEEQMSLAKEAIEQKTTVKAVVKKKKIAKAKAANVANRVSVKKNQPKVYLSDCVEWLRDKGQCDLLLTDPPYITDVTDITVFVDSWLYLALDKVKDTGHAYICIGAYPDEVKAYLTAKIPEHIKLEQILVWTYKNTIGQNPKDRYKQNYQNILFYKGIKAGNLDCPLTTEQWSVQEINAPDGRLGDRFHTWQKPDELAERLIRHSTKVKDIIYDPFVCTGTFVLAGNKLGRVSSGCDISKENLEMAIQRGCIYG